MKEYVEARITQFSKEVISQHGWRYENYINFKYKPNCFTIIGCLYTFLIWIGSFLFIPVIVKIITNVIVFASGCDRGIGIALFILAGIFWFIGVLIDLCIITGFYRKNKKENLPVLSSKIILNGLKTLHDFYGVGTFYREFVYIDSAVTLNSLKFSYNGTYFGGSWLMTYFLYSIIHYDKFALKHKLKVDEKTQKKKQNEKNKQVTKESKERLLKEMLTELKGEKYE